MLVTFHSDAYENLIYLGDIAKQLLALMGHSGSIPGAIKAKDLPDALSQLHQGLAKTHLPEQENDDGEMEISLAKRAVPLVHLLEASIKNNCDVLWS